MNRNVPQTLTDYVLIAINPTLIGLLVGSLMFFLIEVFYQGEYTIRLQFISAMYVLGVVCIARLSIEEGRAYASIYALPLAIVVAIAMARFVSFSGPFAAFSTPISWGLIALGWWSADKLTWDCTVITDAPDTSGQGLLQAVGLDGSAPPQPARASTDREEDASIAASIASAPEPLRKAATWLERRRRAPHTPGVWVVYYSFAALPLFGLGQWFIPAANQASRSFAFGCLVLYVACGLSLLLTTSFLGLRRYLGQKGIYVPLDITATWLTVGGVMIVALLIAAAILPRPNAGGRAAPIAFSPVRSPSQYGVGNDGPQDRSGQRTGPQAKDGKLQGQSPTKDPSGGNQQGGKQQGGKQQGGKQQDGKSSDKNNATDKTDGTNKSDPKNPSDQSDPSKQPASGNPQDKSPPQPPSNANQPPQQSPPQNPPSSYQPNQSPPPQPPSQSSPSQSPSQQQPSQQQPSPPNSSPPNSSPPNSSPPNSSPPKQSQTAPQSRPASSPMNVLGSIGTMLKWLLYVVLACVAVYFAWKYRERIAASWQQFLNELRAWWERLFGKKSAAASAAQEAAAATAPPPRPFADFADPFAMGQAARWTPAQVVTYSFEAFEAWAREHGCPRAVDQTPAEFAQLVAAREPAVSRDARSLADLYSQVAYAKTQPTASSLEPLRRLWQQLQAQVAVV